MITLKDIFKAMCSHISEVSGLPLTDSDIEEPVTRPCFRIFMDTVESGFFSSALRQVKVNFDLYFYAKDEHHSKAEIMEMENKIAFSFLEPLHIKNNCAVYIDNLEFEKLPDGVMNCTFSFEIGTEFIDETELETMENLIINNETEDI